LKKAIKSSLSSQVGYVLSKKAFDSFRKRTDSSEYGGAPLLGVNGITIIGHGRSNPLGIKNAIRVASELCRTRFNEKIEQELAASAAAVRI
jgi:phosphate acyltransferase